MKRRALVSVSDKTGVVEFCRGLVALDWEIVSTGGTSKLLSESGVPCVQVAKVTGFPEMMDGRVRTLHPMVFGGILADREIQAHMDKAAEFAIEMCDLVAVNLYPFQQKQCGNEIDVGGPSMLRAAGKNFRHVIPIIDPADYPMVLKSLQDGRGPTVLQCQALAEKVFIATAKLDTAIAAFYHAHNEMGTLAPLGVHG